MIKAAGEREGKPMLFLGLSGENVTRLCAGEPILVDGAELGVDVHVVIAYGRTEQAIVEELRAGVKLPVREETGT